MWRVKTRDEEAIRALTTAAALAMWLAFVGGALDAWVYGLSGAGDFVMAADGRLERRGERAVAPYIYAGVAILSPGLFADTPEGAFSLNLLFDRAIAAGRLFGMRLDGQWLHVGTPEAIRAAEERVKASARIL